MPSFTIETTYHLPVYRQRTFEAPSGEEACRLAIEDDDWDSSRMDYECAGETYVTGIWLGSRAAYAGVSVPIPSPFNETSRWKADHFDVLVALVREAAQPQGSVTTAEAWFSRARNTLAEVDAITESCRARE